MTVLSSVAVYTRNKFLQKVSLLILCDVKLYDFTFHYVFFFEGGGGESIKIQTNMCFNVLSLNEE